MADKQDFKQFIFGKVMDLNKPFSMKDIEEIIARGRQIQQSGVLPSLEQLSNFFSRLSNAWSDPAYHLRKEALEVLKENTGMSEGFINLVLQEFAKVFSPQNLMKRLEGEFGDSSIQDRPVLQKSTNTRLIVRPAGLVLHVVAGNVFTGAIESLIDGIVTKNINFLKMSSDDRDFPIIFARSIMECDEEGIISGRIALLWWPHQETEIENLFKQTMDRILFWGGHDALLNWKNGLGLQAILIQHGPKISFGVISKTGMEAADLNDLSYKIALDVSLWEQKACNCPQMLFIEDTISEDKINLFMNALQKGFKKINSEMPPASRSSDDHVEVLRFRELAIAKDIMTDGHTDVFGPDTLDWTIVHQKSSQGQQFELSPLNRAIIIKHYASLNSLANLIKDNAFYLQTAGYCLGHAEVSDYAITLFNMGVTRLCPFGIMSIVAAGTPHDGSYALRDLTRMTVIE